MAGSRGVFLIIAASSFLLMASYSPVVQCGNHQQRYNNQHQYHQRHQPVNRPYYYHHQYHQQQRPKQPYAIVPHHQSAPLHYYRYHQKAKVNAAVPVVAVVAVPPAPPAVAAAVPALRLSPSPLRQSVVELLVNNSDRYSTLVTAVKAAALVDTLSTGTASIN